MTQPKERVTQPKERTQPEVVPSEDAERGRPIWALLGLLIAVSAAVFIMTLGFSAG